MAAELNKFSVIGFTSLSQQVTNELRKSIIENRLKAGTRITESELSESLGVSRTVIREAISILNKDGLLDRESSHCTKVAKYSARDIKEIYDMRACLESSALELMGDPTAIADILKTKDEESHSIAKAEPFDGLAFVIADMDFHTCIIKAADNSLLLDAWYRIVGPLQVLLHRYIYYIVNNTIDKRASYDHQRIITAFYAGDKELINKVLVDHCRIMKDILLKELIKPEEDSEKN